MKPSHLRTPRTLSDCYFVEGYYTIEPAMWQNRWGSTTYQESKSTGTIYKILAAVAIIAAVTIALVVPV